MIGRTLVTLAQALALVAAFPARAQDDGKQWLTLADGESRDILGATYTASGPVQAVVVLSSELATVAVIDGTLSSGRQAAGPGEALVTPVESGKTERLVFDAARLKPTLRPEWLASAAPALDAIAARQKRAKFWGRLEPSGVNATATGSPLLESIRESYMANPVVADLRRRAGGKTGQLAPLTAQAFASAVTQGDAATVAALIDPKPFSDSNTQAEDWQAARRAFAARLTGDAALRSGLGAEAPAADPAQPAQYLAGRYRITLVKRDRALFVASVEPQS